MAAALPSSSDSSGDATAATPVAAADSPSAGIQPTQAVLRFLPWAVAVDAAFWPELARFKLNESQLSEDPVPLTAAFQPAANGRRGTLLIPSNALRGGVRPPPGQLPFNGSIMIMNSFSRFKAEDGKDMISSWTRSMLTMMNQMLIGAQEDNSADPKLFGFLIIAYHDPKNFKFFYKVAAPTLFPNKPFEGKAYAAVQYLKEETIKGLANALFQSRNEHHVCSLPFTASRVTESIIEEVSPHHYNPMDESTYILVPDISAHREFLGWTLRNILIFISLCVSRKSKEKNLPLVHSHANNIKILCVRGPLPKHKDDDKCVKESKILSLPIDSLRNDALIEGIVEDKEGCGLLKLLGLKVSSGWTTNKSYEEVDLSAFMDKKRMASSAAELNLQLMAWRHFPELNLPLIKRCRVLLLGCGSLGCFVARQLLAWGFRDFILLDSGRVSYSNPVRQPLFTYADCFNASEDPNTQDGITGGAFKAQAAAYRLKEIFPEVQCDAHVLSIPMPGRCSVLNDSEIISAAAKIDSLVCSSDAVMLLTDSKESRWLPTAICKTRNVLAITVALGFDSYLVMRHGSGTMNNSPNVSAAQLGESSQTSGKAEALGCYFCNDVVAPGDSSVSTTLDQQCTVTRPGVAPVAAALGVEMLVGMLHCGAAYTDFGLPTDESPSSTMGNVRLSGEQGVISGQEEQERRIRFHHIPGDVALTLSDGLPRPLGILQHQIRGFMAHGTSLQTASPAYRHCTACSASVTEAVARSLDSYKERISADQIHTPEEDFLVQAMRKPCYLEQISGLSQHVHNMSLDEEEGFDGNSFGDSDDDF